MINATASITFQRKSGTRDDFGTLDSDTWTDLLTCDARKSLRSGREFERLSMSLSDIDEVFTVWYCTELADLTELDRVKFDTKYYDIRYVDNILNKNRELQISCTLHR